jgi:hypothetical protein
MTRGTKYHQTLQNHRCIVIGPFEREGIEKQDKRRSYKKTAGIQ